MAESLNPFDLVTLVVIVAATFWGGMRGIITQLASILSWVVSWYVATHYYSFVARFIDENATWRTPAATVITFVITALAIRLASNFIRSALSMAGLREFDRQMGALLGAFKGLLFCLLVTFFATIVSDDARAVVEGSKSGPFFVKIILKINEHVPESELTKKFASYATVIKENDEIDESEESIEAQVSALARNLINGGFLSNSASEIVEEAESEAKTDEATASQKAQSSLFRGFVSSVSNFKNNAQELFRKEPASESSVGTKSADDVASDWAGYPTNNASNYASSSSYYPNDAAYADSDSNAYGRYGDVDQTPNAHDAYASLPPATSENATTRPYERATSDLRESVSAGLSEFLYSIGRGYGSDYSTAADSAVDGYASARNAGQNDYQGAYDPYYDDYPTRSSYSSRSRSSRSSGSKASRSRLNSRSYEIGE